MTDDLPEVRREHPFLMYDMMKESAAGIKKTLDVMGSVDYSFLTDELTFTGNGTAYHSSTLGAQVLSGSGRKWHSIQSFEVEHYHRVNGTLVGFSHTGKTKSTVDAMKSVPGDVKKVGVTHYPGTPLLKASDHGIIIGDSPDMSLCNTKAFFDNAFAALEIAARFGGTDSQSRELFGIVEKEITGLEGAVKEAAGKLSGVNDIFVLGAGPSLIAARESAQKLKESTHLHAEGIELEEFNHGCTSVIDDRSLVVIINSPEVNYRARDIVNACRTVGTRTFVLNGEGDFSIDVDSPSNNLLYPVAAMVPLYYLSYFLAVEKGVNPDYLRFEDRRYLDYDNIVFPPGAH